MAQIGQHEARSRADIGHESALLEIQPSDDVARLLLLFTPRIGERAGYARSAILGFVSFIRLIGNLAKGGRRQHQHAGKSSHKDFSIGMASGGSTRNS